MWKSYLKYRRKAVNAHGIHSPFVYMFYQKVVRRRNHTSYPLIEKGRKTLKQDKRSIEVTDFGAGSRKNKGNVRKVSEIAKNAAMSKNSGQLLARLTEFYGCKRSLELGTSLGIGTAYLASGSKEVYVLSVEGCPEIAGIARENLKGLGLDNVKIINQEFDEALQSIEGLFDLIYIDGNHQYEATLNYFNYALEHSHDDTFIVFDDIYWSDEMKHAWKTICAAEAVHLSMDLFRLGIVCKRPGQRKEHFILKQKLL